MRFNSRGQSLLEYASVVILIMLGMIIGKNVIDRGAKAGIKNLTQSVEDSDLEIITQGGDTGYNLPNCNCTPWQNGGCGPAGGCSAIERYQTRLCVPQGCALQYGIITEKCTSDGGCCTQPQLVGTPGDSCGVNAVGFNPPNGCEDDWGWSWWQCGGTPLPPPQFGCRHDMQNPSQCQFRCNHGNLWPNCSTPCDAVPGPNDLPPCLAMYGCFFNGDNARLTQSTNQYNLVAGPGNCDHLPGSPTPCKAYCTNGLVPKPNGTCGCPDPLMVLQFGCVCECPSGYIYNNGSCPSGQCSTSSCPVDQCSNGTN